MLEGGFNTVTTVKKPKIGKIISWCIFSALFLLLSSALISVLVTKSKGNTPNIFGLYIYKVQSASMEPTLNTGDMIVSVRPKDCSKLTNGQIITFRRNNITVTHRVVGFHYDGQGVLEGYITKGDNAINSVDEGYVAFSDIEAVFILKLF